MDDIIYRSMYPEDETQVRELYYSFMRGAPLESGLKMEVYHESVSTLVNYALAEALHNKVSVVAIDNIAQKIIGFRACAIATPGNPQNWEYPQDDADCKKIIKKYEIVGQLYSELNLFTEYNVDTIVRYRGLHVHKNYTNRGIATKMVEKILEICKAVGIELAAVESSNNFSRSIFNKLGFVTVSELKYANYIADGTLDMPDECPHKSLTLHVKRI